MLMSLNIHSIQCDTDPVAAPEFVNQHWVNTTTGDMWLSNGTATINNWVKININNIIIETITASSNTDLDTILLSSLCTVKYIVCVSSSTENKWRSFEMLAGKITSTTVEDTVYSSIGSPMDVDFDFLVSGSSAKLVGTNNETFDVDIKIIKSIL